MVTFINKSSPVSIQDKQTNLIYQIQWIGDLNKSDDYKNNVINALKFNLQNNFIEKIYLIVNKTYLDIDFDNLLCKKIVQIEIKNELTWDLIFNIIKKLDLNGFVTFSYLPTILNYTIDNLNYQKIDYQKNYWALLSWNYKINDNLDDCVLNTPSGNKYVALIVHSQLINSINPNYFNTFSLPIEHPNSFSKLIYLFDLLGFIGINNPEAVKIYSYSESVPNTQNFYIPSPYSIIIPEISQSNTVVNELNNLSTYNIDNSNKKLYEYIKNKITNNEQFIIPRISNSIDSQAVFLAEEIKPHLENKEKILSDYNDLLMDYLPRLAMNSGINCSNLYSLIEFNHSYLDAFDKSDLYLNMEPYSDSYVRSKESHDYITDTFKKDMCWNQVLEIYNYVNYQNVWTELLANKKILLITPYADSIKSNINKQEQIYGKNFFPNCSFEFLKVCQIDETTVKNDWMVNFLNLCDQINGIKDDFDIALVSCGGYSNPLLSYLLSIGKSGINVGSVLQMYWGVYGEKWILEKPDIIALYSNNNWIRPLDSDKPDKQYISGSVYW